MCQGGAGDEEVEARGCGDLVAVGAWEGFYEVGDVEEAEAVGAGLDKEVEALEGRDCEVELHV